MSTQNISDEHIEEIIRDEIKENYSEHKEALEKIMMSLVIAARKHIDNLMRKANGRSISSITHMISTTIERMVHEIEGELLYDEYCELMARQGIKPLEYREKFKKPIFGNPNPYNRFEKIKEKGIKLGDRLVDHDGIECRVHKITDKCMIRVIYKDGRIEKPLKIDNFEKVN